jgi:hypothetical protein
MVHLLNFHFSNSRGGTKAAITLQMSGDPAIHDQGLSPVRTDLAQRRTRRVSTSKEIRAIRDLFPLEWIFFDAVN